jgi:hypothetical protein
MRVGGAAGRLIEFCQRERGAQFEAPHRLLPCDRDGGEKASSSAAAFAGARLSKISPRMRCSSASHQRSPV